jgi:hypothetical protein
MTLMNYLVMELGIGIEPIFLQHAHPLSAALAEPATKVRAATPATKEPTKNLI